MSSWLITEIQKQMYYSRMTWNNGFCSGHHKAVFSKLFCNSSSCVFHSLCPKTDYFKSLNTYKVCVFWSAVSVSLLPFLSLSSLLSLLPSLFLSWSMSHSFRLSVPPPFFLSPCLLQKLIPLCLSSSHLLIIPDLWKCLLLFEKVESKHGKLPFCHCDRYTVNRHIIWVQSFSNIIWP